MPTRARIESIAMMTLSASVLTAYQSRFSLSGLRRYIHRIWNASISTNRAETPNTTAEKKPRVRYTMDAMTPMTAWTTNISLVCLSDANSLSFSQSDRYSLLLIVMRQVRYCQI